MANLKQTEDATLARAALEIDPDGQPIRGTLTPAEGRPLAFSGWAELAAVIEDVRTGSHGRLAERRGVEKRSGGATTVPGTDPNPHPKGAPPTSRLAGVFTALINSAAIAAEMALLKPPDPPSVEHGSQPPPAQGDEIPTPTRGTRRLRTIGGDR